MKKIISLLFMFVLLGTTAFAAEEAVYDIDAENHKITISGTVSPYEGVPIVIIKPAEVADSDNGANVALFADKTFFSPVRVRVDSLLKTGDAQIDETNINEYRLHFTFVFADADGNYKITLPIPAEAVNDMVYLLTTSGGSYANNFEAIAVYAPSDATIEAAKAAVNGATTANALVAAINQYDTVFGLDTENSVYKSMSFDIASAIIAMNRGSAYTSFTDVRNDVSFKSHYNAALAYYKRQTDAVNEINGATVDSLKTILENYSQDENVLGYYSGAKLDFETAYNKYGYLEMNRLLVGITYENMAEFAEAFKKAAEELDGKKDTPTPGTPQNPSKPTGPGGSASGGAVYVPTTKVPVVEQEYSEFSDLNQVAWAEDSILSLVERGVVNGMGDGTFNPNGNVTREQFVKMLLLSFNAELLSTSGPFTDVDNDAWYATYVNTAYELGIVNGVSKSEFGVGNAITRQDLVTMIVRACEVFGITFLEEYDITFTDVNEIADYAQKAVMTMASAGVINGVSEGVFAPLDNATRAQVAVMLDRLYNI